MISLKYNTLDLNASPYKLHLFDGYSIAKREIKTVDLSRQDGGIQVSERFASKTINVEGMIKASSKPNLIVMIDQLKAYMAKAGGNLVLVDEDGVERTWVCTPTSIIITRPRGGATQVPFAIEFFCPKPYSESQTVTLLNTTITTAPINTPISISGTYKASPLIVLTINSITGGAQTITIGNQANSRSISITGTFAAGTTITIDCDKRDLYINTTKSDYTGTFPEWEIGGGSISYTDTASARNVGILMTAKVRNL